MNNLGDTPGSLTTGRGRILGNAVGERAMTLAEVLVAIAIFGLVFGSVVTGLGRAHYRAVWAAYNTSASKLAEQRLEQVLNARWDPNASPSIDQVASTNFPSDTPVLDAYMGGGAVTANRSVTITNIPSAASPVYKGTTVQVVWSLRGRGPFTNSVFSLRAPDQ